VTGSERAPLVLSTGSAPVTRMLLVEDNPGDARLFRETLAEGSSSQVELTHVTRLSDAAAALAAAPFDLVLLDLSLPDSMGIETFRALARVHPLVPYVVLTGLADEDLGMVAVREGAQDFLIKGAMQPEALVRALAHAVVRHRRRDRAPGDHVLVLDFDT
jgi:CheY-like chemotaxis protein